MWTRSRTVSHRGVSGTPTASTDVVGINRGGRSTPGGLQDSVSGSGGASLRGVVADAFLTQLDTRWRLWGDWDLYSIDVSAADVEKVMWRQQSPVLTRVLIFSGLFRDFPGFEIPISTEEPGALTLPGMGYGGFQVLNKAGWVETRVPCPWSGALVSDKVTMDGLRT